MALVLADEKTIVRDMCGDPDTTELPDATLERMLATQTLNWLNRRRPKVVIRSLTTIAGQQDYDSKPSNAYYIGHVWYKATTWTTFDPTMEFIPGALDIDDQLAGFDVIDNPGLVTAFYRKISHYEHTFNGCGEETSEGKIRLMPEPNTGGDTVWFESAEPRWTAFTSIGDEWKQAVEHHAAYLALTYLSIKRSIITGGRDWSGGAGRNEKTIADEYLSMAEGFAPEVIPFRLG